MATISRYRTQSGKSLFRVRYRTPDRRQTDKRGFRTKREAEAFAATVEHSKLVGAYVSPSAGRVTVGEVFTRWRDGLGHLRPKTLENALSSYRKHVEPRWSTTPVGDVRPPAIRSWVATMSADGAGPATIERALGILRQVLQVAVEDGNVATNPAAGVKAPRRQHRGRGYLDHRQVHELADAAGGASPLIFFLAYSGLRFGEAAALRLRDVDMLRRRVTVERSVVEVGGKMDFGAPKTHERRSVPIPEFVALAIAGQMEGKGRDALVFGDGEAPVRVNNWRRREFARALSACQASDSTFPTVTVHDLRHSAASLAISAGANVKAVQTMMGHASAAMTLDTYADLFPDDLERVAAALDEAVRQAMA